MENEWVEYLQAEMPEPEGVPFYYSFNLGLPGDDWILGERAVFEILEGASEEGKWTNTTSSSTI